MTVNEQVTKMSNNAWFVIFYRVLCQECGFICFSSYTCKKQQVSSYKLPRIAKQLDDWFECIWYTSLMEAGASEGSEQTKHWRGKPLFTNNGLPIQYFVSSEPSDAPGWRTFWPQFECKDVCTAGNGFLPNYGQPIYSIHLIGNSICEHTWVSESGFTLWLRCVGIRLYC